MRPENVNGDKSMIFPHNAPFQIARSANLNHRTIHGTPDSIFWQHHHQWGLLVVRCGKVNIYRENP